MDTADWIQIGIMSGTFVGVFLTLFSIIKAGKNFKSQLQLTFFADYTKRFQEIILNLPIGIYNKSFSLGDLDSDARDQTIKYMKAYFDLCSEEHDLYINGHLEERIWKEWKGGIEFFLSKDVFQEGWQIVNAEEGYYPVFSKLVNHNTSVKKGRL